MNNVVGLKIDTRMVNEISPVFIIAELSGNHLQDYEVAVKTVEAISQSGADAVKLQTYTPDTITIDCDNDYFQITQGTIWDGRTLYQLYQEAYTPWEWQPRLKKLAEDFGLLCFSSAFDRSAVDFLEEIDVPAHKVASFEITDIPLIEYIASKGKPVIISTGIATLSDVQEAMDACRRMGNDQIALLQCTSAYPAPLEEVNLRTIPDLARRFNVVSGLSDHTLGMSLPIAATVLGAKIIEKHFILARDLGGPDAPFSMEPGEFKAMVKGVREVEKALGGVCYELGPKALRSREHARSLFVVKDIMAREFVTSENVRSIRPGQGIHPRHLKDVVGKKVKKAITRGTPLTWELLES